MAGKSGSKTNRAAWLVMHAGILAWVLCLIVLAEEHREGGDPCPAIAEKPAGGTVDSSQADETRVWVDRQIAGLGDPVFGVRAKATRQLIAAGPKVVKRLSLALCSHDPEVFRRAQYILARLIRSDDGSFHALENIAATPDHPAAKTAETILQQECDRREHVLAALAEQRKLDAHRYLREARAALYQGDFDQARRKARAAEALDATYNLFDDHPKLVLHAIEKAEARAQSTPSPAVITAERE